MRAIEISHPGPPDVLRLVERPTPHPGTGEVLIAVRAAGVTRADAVQRAGNYAPPPGASDIPGLEVSGTIAELGEGVSNWRAGDAVCALLTGGGYAEYAVAPASVVLPIPENWNFIEAATLPENAFTVYDNLFTRAHLQAGESVLIHGGSSGIGTIAIMFSRAFGIGFIATTAGSDAKCEACMDLGADLAVNYKRDDFVQAVKRATGDRGVDVILDMVGGAYLVRDLQTLAPDGRIVFISTPQGRMAELDIGALMQRRASVMGSALRPRPVEQKAAIAQRLLQFVWPKLPARDPIKPVMDSTFPLEQAAAAHRRLEESVHIGKIVLVI
jgi:NADPH2:quinone reductase